MEGINVEDFDEMDLNSTTYSEFAADLPGHKDVFSSSFLSNRNYDPMNSIKEEPDSDTTPTEHSQSLAEISRVSSFFDGIAGLPNNQDSGITFSDSTWLPGFDEDEDSDDTFTSQNESPQPILNDICQNAGSKKNVKKSKGNKRKISEIVSQVEKANENVSRFKRIQINAPSSSLSNQMNSKKSIDIVKKIATKKEPKLTEETNKRNPKRCKIIPKQKTVKSSFSCAVGSKSFSTKKRLNAHTKTHKNTSSSDPCGFCGKTFRWMSNKKTHEYTHMSWNQLQKTRVFHAKCYFCNDHKIFLNYRDYEIHLNTHLAEKPYKCRICSKRFAQTSGLKKHEVVHSKEKKFKCKKCGKRFTQSNSLKAHDLVHLDKTTREKTEKSWKYECEFCKKKFQTPFHLNNHTAIHTGEKKFTCSHCHQTFTQNSSKKRHEKSQH